MARPAKNNAEYFGHEGNLRDKPLVKALRAKFGCEGYTVLCMLKEVMTSADGITVQWGGIHVDILSGDIGLPVERLTEIVEYMIKLGLLAVEEKEDGVWLIDAELRERLKPLFDKREKMKRYNEKKQTNKTTNEEIIPPTITPELHALKRINSNNGRTTLTKTYSKTMVIDAKTGVSAAEMPQSLKYKDLKSNKNYSSVEELGNSSTCLNREIENFSDFGEENLNQPTQTKPKPETVPRPEKPAPSIEGLEFAEWFKERLPPERRVSSRDLVEWAHTYDKMIRIDKRSAEEIRRVCAWALNDDLWRQHFLSVTKLRKRQGSSGVTYYEIFLVNLNHGNSNNRTFAKPKPNGAATANHSEYANVRRTVFDNRDGSITVVGGIN